MPKATLTYFVPRELESRLVVGKRVLVPLGRRTVTGFCIQLHQEKPAVGAKPIRDVLDERAVFSAPLLQLARWMHTYYYCTLADAMRAMLPQGIDIETTQYVSITEDGQRKISDTAQRATTKSAILTALVTGEYLSVAELKMVIAKENIAQPLRDLERDGLVRIEHVLDEPRVQRKKALAVRLLEPWMHAERFKELCELMEKRAPKQVNIVTVLYRALHEGRATVPMTQLVREARATSAQVRALEEKEIVAVELVEVVREYTQQFEEALRDITLTQMQSAVIDAVAAKIETGAFQSYLLHGVTASGKTQVYIELIRRTLERNRTALVLVPEITLTPQVVFRFKTAFGGDVAVMHSRMSIGERYDAWRLTLEGRYKVIVGVRSAVFAPLASVGLIIVDEEHESSYKQQDVQPRYHARDVAVVRASIESAVVVLGSATPSAESYFNATHGKYTMLSLPERVDGAQLPRITPIDLAEARKQRRITGSLTTELIERIADRLQKKESVIILQNRRGFAPQLECHECGHVEQCANCSISMTYHKVNHHLRCHYCGSMSRVPDICPRCGGVRLEQLGAGTQRIEEEIAAAFPAARLLRMDLDTTTRKGAHDAMLTSFYEGDADILVGTQMVSKGLDFPRVTLVGVVNADQSLLLPDFRAAERTFQILTQVSGRSGRGDIEGDVIIQSTQLLHPVMQCVFAHDFDSFITHELKLRSAFHYPPFSRLVLVEFSGEDEDAVASSARRFSSMIPERTHLFYKHAATPSAIRRLNKRYRYHILLKVNKQHDPTGAVMTQYLRSLEEKMASMHMPRSVRMTVDVDPQSLM